MKNKLINFLINCFIFLITVGWIFSGWPQIWQNPPIPPEIKEVQAAVSYVGAGGAVKVASGNMVSVGVPVGIQNNDILIVIVHSRDNVNSTMPAGWTQKVEDNGSTTNRLEVWWKRTTGTESAPTVTRPGGNSAIARMHAFRGLAESGDPFNVVGTVQRNTGSPISTAAITTTVDRAMILHLFGSQDDNTWGSYTGIPTNIAGVDTNTLGTDNSLGLIYGTQSTAGLTGTAGAGQTARGPDAGASVLMALKPLPEVVAVGTIGSQVFSMNIPSTNQYVGGAFTFVRNLGNTNVTQIIISETGTVNANLNLSNINLYYETAASCSYEGNETFFGTTDSFNASEKATVSGTMTVGTSQVCVYMVLDVGPGTLEGDTLEIEISNPSTEVTVSAGSVSPATPVAIAGTTTLTTVIPPATWKAAEDTSITGVNKNENIRLRIQITNTGGEAPDYDYILEYAEKIGSSCGDDESFIALPIIAETQHFEMADSIYITNKEPTTTQLTVPDSYNFVSGKMIENPSNSSGNLFLSFENYTEIEFVFQATNNAINEGNYCFRLTDAGNILENYPVYPELQIASAP